MTALRHALAAYAHDEAWSGWMRYLFSKSTENEDGSVTIPPALVERWQRQVATPYPQLSPKEQESVLAEADKMLAIASKRHHEIPLNTGHKLDIRLMHPPVVRQGG